MSVIHIPKKVLCVDILCMLLVSCICSLKSFFAKLFVRQKLPDCRDAGSGAFILFIIDKQRLTDGCEGGAERAPAPATQSGSLDNVSYPYPYIHKYALMKV